MCTPLKRQSVREAGKKKKKKKRWEEGEEKRHPGGRRGRKAAGEFQMKCQRRRRKSVGQ